LEPWKRWAALVASAQNWRGMGRDGKFTEEASIFRTGGIVDQRKGRLNAITATIMISSEVRLSVVAAAAHPRSGSIATAVWLC